MNVKIIRRNLIILFFSVICFSFANMNINAASDQFEEMDNKIIDKSELEKTYLQKEQEREIENNKWNLINEKSRGLFFKKQFKK